MSRPGMGSKPAGKSLKVRVKTGKGKTASQKIWLERQLNDPYVHEAKKLGYRSRAAFKLIEIDDKFKFLKSGGRVVDLARRSRHLCVHDRRLRSRSKVLPEAGGVHA